MIPKKEVEEELPVVAVRDRGRPAKEVVSDPSGAATKRGRGRPRKSVGETSTAGAKRGRGRPAKAVAESSAAGAKRGRGRPPKCGRGDGGTAGSLKIPGNRSPSPARSPSPEGGYWDQFPISEFLMILFEPIGRTQSLPQAVADALEGEGPFRFLLHRVGARQGPWEVLSRVVLSQEGGAVRRKAEFFSG